MVHHAKHVNNFFNSIICSCRATVSTNNQKLLFYLKRKTQQIFRLSRMLLLGPKAPESEFQPPFMHKSNQLQLRKVT
jgi:hypothetical protein